MKSSHLVLCIACLLLSWAFRIARLDGGSLWLDEGFTLARVQLSAAEILAGYINFGSALARDVQPPFYFLLVHAVGHLAGWSQLSLRLLSVGASLLAVAVAFAIGRRLFDARVGLIAALLVGASPLYLWYARELRSYSLVVFLVLLATYLSLRLFDSVTRRETSGWLFAAWFVCAGLLVYTHYLAALPVLFQAGILAVLWLRQRWQWLIVAAIAAVPLSIPVYLISYQRLTTPEPGFSFIPLSVILNDLLINTLMGMSSDRDGYWMMQVVWLGLWIAGLAAIFVRKSKRRVNLGALAVAFLTIAPLAAFYAISIAAPIYMGVRHIMFVTPLFYLTLASGVGLLLGRSALLGGTLLVALAGVMGFETYRYYFDPSMQKDDYRALVTMLEQRVSEHDLVMLSDHRIGFIVDYYNQQYGTKPLTWISLPGFGAPVREGTFAELQEQVAAHENLWYVYGPYGSYDDPEMRLLGWVEANLAKVEDHVFQSRDVTVAAARYVGAMFRTSVTRLPERFVEVSFTDGLRLIGYDLLSRAPVRPGEAIHVATYWSSSQPVTGDLEVTLKLVDSTNVSWSETTVRLKPGQGDSQLWQGGGLVRFSPMILETPPGLPPGPYELDLHIVDATTGSPFYRLDAQRQPQGVRVDLGRVLIGPVSAWSPGILRTVDVRSRIHWYGLIELVGYSMKAVTKLHQGDGVSFEVVFRSLRPVDQRYRLLVQLTDVSGAVSRSFWFDLGSPSYPLHQWQPGDTLRARYTFVIPPDLPPGRYRTTVRLAGSAAFSQEPGWYRGIIPVDSTVEIGRIEVDEQPRRQDLPEIEYPLLARFEDSVQLLGYNIAVERDPHLVRLQLTSFWRVIQTPGRSLKTTFQALAPGPRVVAQSDGTPGDQGRSSTSWLPGEVIIDRRQITLESASMGDLIHQLVYIVALYDEQGTRILAEQDGTQSDHVVLPIPRAVLK